MPFEIDFLPVGTGTRSGDAIALRYGPDLESGQGQTVVTIDGGTRESGKALVDHVRTFYKTSTVDFAILTHPDSDHASGMREVLESLDVKRVLMHLPWEHSAAVKRLVDDRRVTVKSLDIRAANALVAAREVAEQATANDIEIIEPFAGTKTKSGSLIVLGPTRDYYLDRLANFKFMPSPKQATIESTLARYFGSSGLEFASWNTELLATPAEGASSAENNSSTVLLFSLDGEKILLTGDAGVPAIKSAIDFADANSISVTGINLFQIPHHGSRKNLSNEVLNRLFGQIQIPANPTWHAFVSAAPNGSPKHPNKKITNAIQQRGGVISSTATGQICYFKNCPARTNYGPIAHLPFYHFVEGDGDTA